ncbi:MAG TPA: YetF domain-containing protein [Patescibacteria group bacterium]|nr:YetF domain-containing protein [Patescibacteria group bacterium]
MFALVLAGLKLVGRRVFGEQSPQDLVILLLIAECCDLGLTHEEAGYWGTVVSVITILFLGWLCERVGLLRKAISSSPVVIYQNGKLERELMEHHMLDESDLHEAARHYGLEKYQEFRIITLEGDGDLTGVPREGALRQGSVG